MENNLENRLEHASSGERRLDPDQQRKYLQTFKERVVLSISFKDASNPKLIKAFPKILTELKEKYENLAVKINGNLPDTVSMTYAKDSSQEDIPMTIISEHTNTSLGIVVHTDRAVKISDTDINSQYANYLENTADKPVAEKKSFWKHFFN